MNYCSECNSDRKLLLCPGYFECQECFTKFDIQTGEVLEETEKKEMDELIEMTKQPKQPFRTQYFNPLYHDYITWISTMKTLKLKKHPGEVNEVLEDLQKQVDRISKSSMLEYFVHMLEYAPLLSVGWMIEEMCGHMDLLYEPGAYERASEKKPPNTEFVNIVKEVLSACRDNQLYRIVDNKDAADSFYRRCLPLYEMEIKTTIGKAYANLPEQEREDIVDELWELAHHEYNPEIADLMIDLLNNKKGSSDEIS